MKKNICIIIVLLLNILIAYLITSVLGIKSIVLFQSLTAVSYSITYEIVIWFVLILIEYVIYKTVKKHIADNKNK